MRFWDLCRFGNWPALLGTLVYLVTSFALCALLGGAAFDLPLSNLEVGLMLSAPIVGGALLLSVMMFIEFTPWVRSTSPRGLENSPPGFGVPHPGAWGLVCFLYSVTFGCFAALAGYLGVFFHVQHGLSAVQAAVLTTVVAAVGFALRPVGGYLAGRFGDCQLLLIVFIGAGILLLDLAVSRPLAWTTVLPILIMGLLALGNGAVVQLIPQRFPGQSAAVNMLAAIAGGLGGCLLAVCY